MTIVKKTVWGFIILLGAGTLSGCLVTEQRLPSTDAPSAESPLLGLWQSPWPATLTRESLNITYVAGQDHYVVVRGRGKYYGQDNQGRSVEVQETAGYKAYPSKVGSRWFFSLLSMKGEPNVYAIVETVLENENKHLVVREPADEAVERAMSQGKLVWRLEEDSKVVTSSPEAVAAWLGTLEESDFKNHEIFERWPSAVDDLKKHLNKNP